MNSQLLRKKYQSALTASEREYLVFLPGRYELEKEREWPLLLFLHGMGERGDDVEAVLRHGPIKEALRSDRELPIVMLGPQCPILKDEDPAVRPVVRLRRGEATSWAECEAEVMSLLDATLGEYRIDRRRIYLTGLSMGGFGSWLLAARYPGRWAAVAPVCGGGNPAEAAAIGKVPVWAFHGQLDEAVLPKASKEMVEALSAAGGDVRLTLYPDLAHNCWDRVYGGSDLYMWLLSHRQEGAGPY